MTEKTFAGPFFHGSYQDFPMGFRFRGRGDSYHEEWQVLTHYEALHRHAPEGVIHHRDAVFMCDNVENTGMCGGATDRAILLKPLGPVTRHDFDWTGHISLLIAEGASIDSNEVREACLAYWSGEPMGPESDVIWEYLTTEAEVLACGDHDDPEIEEILLEFWEEDQDAGMEMAI